MKKRSLVKKEIRWQDLKIQLLEIQDPLHVPYLSISNLIAVDETNKIIWTAEVPKTHHDYYYDITIDTQTNMLISNSGIGYRYLINLESGKILNHYLVK